MYLLRP